MNMNTNNQTLYYNWEKKEDYAYFAYYTNQALNNAFMILGSITQVVLNKNDNAEDNNLWSNSKIIDLLKNNKNPVAQKSVINLLERHLPFAVKSLSDPQMIGNRLSYFLCLLKTFRNEYAHYRESSLDKSTKATKNELEEFRFGAELLTLKEAAIKEVERRHEIDLTVLSSGSPYQTFKERFSKETSKESFVEEDFIFFLSLFLSTRETQQLLNGIRGKKSTENKEFQWVRKVFTVFGAQRFRQKIKSDAPQEALLLNIINDLSKIPAHLKKYLNVSAKEKLVYSVQESEDEEGETIVQKAEAVTKHGELYSFRCLQFLEHFEYLNKINFNINLGKVFVRKPYKKLVNGENYLRSLDKEIHAFGKLKDFDDTYFTGYIKRDETESGTVPKFIKPLKFYSPKYHFTNNRIGFNIAKPSQKIHLQPFNKEDKFFIKNEVPEFIISENAIPYFTYCMINYEERKVENVLRTFESNFRKFLRDIKDGENIELEDLEVKYSLKKHWIPSLILKNYFTTNQKTFEDVVNGKMELLKTRTNELIEGYKKFEKDPKEVDKNLRFSFKKGDLATFIARDIVYLMKPDYQNGEKMVSKLSSIEYDILQSKLAFYAKNETDLKVLFKQWKLYDKHPFLSKVSMDKVKDRNGKPRQIGIKKFFKNYLYQREKWLCTYHAPITKENYHFIDDYKTSKSREQVSTYAANLMNHSIYLPTDLFLDLIAKNSNIAGSPRTNISYLISENLSKYESQWFYKSENYKELSWGSKECHQRDKEIRKAVMFDRIYWEMLCKANAIPELADVFSNNDLSVYNKERDFLERQIQMSVNYPFGNKSIKIRGQRKLKDFGAFRHLLKDRRLPDILSYYDKGGHEEVNYLDLEEEIQLFDRNKILILKEILEIDEAIYRLLKKEGKTIDQNFRENFEKLDYDEEEQNEISNIRNKLLHNQVPDKVLKYVQYNKEKKFSESLYEIMAVKCTNSLKKLSSQVVS